MQEFLSLYAKIENPTFEMVLFTFLLAFICSTCIALTYYYTTPTTLKTANYIQALILSSIIATMILQSIGDNVASGLGILGALTIINFRTSFRDPRDIIFMFAALGIGIACGSYVFQIAMVGTVLFCLLAFCLKFSPFSLGNHLIWELRVRVNNPDNISKIESVINKFCKRYSLDGLKNIDKVDGFIQDRDYVVIFHNDKEMEEMLAEIQKIGGDIRKFNNQNSEATEV
ncbi:MAG: DUF4956 domain-containing protein [Saprospiraceae bacterium]|nr:DUF4956 domain-containing protein [Saprospiraceae bacterium]